MTKANDALIQSLLMQSERDGCCIVANSATLNRLLARHAKTGSLLRVSRGLFADPDYWSGLTKAQQTLHIMRGLSQLHPSWIFCSYSAAVAYGLSVSNSLLNKTHIIGPRNTDKLSSRITYHAIPQQTPRIVNGFRCTSLEQTLFDVARLTSTPKALAIVDSALRLGSIDKANLLDYFDTCKKGYLGAKKARRVAKNATHLSESGGESIARGLMIENGFKIPELQVEVLDPMNHNRKYRVDFLWRTNHGLIIGEFDGREKYLNPQMTGNRGVENVLIDERLRESRISITGAKIMRFGYKDLINEESFVKLLETFGVPKVNQRNS